MSRKSAKTPANIGIGFFADIPEVIQEEGRVKGFERMRDKIFLDWETLSQRCNPYSLLKLAIESDRHAMFSQIAEEKAKGTFDKDLWLKYQDYLSGNVDVVPDQGDFKGSEVSDKPLYDGGDPFAHLADDEPEEDEDGRQGS